MLLADLPPNLPVLFLATAKVPQAELEEQVASIFGSLVFGMNFLFTSKLGRLIMQASFIKLFYSFIIMMAQILDHITLVSVVDVSHTFIV